MMLRSYLLVALLMVRQKPVRCVLSILGIYIGVLSLVVILSIHEGMRLFVEDLYLTQGANVFMIQPGFDEASQKVGTLTLAHIRELKSLGGVKTALPRLVASKQVRGQDDSEMLQFLGADEDFTYVYRVPLSAGRSFLPKEIKGRAPVMMLTEKAAKKLFPLKSPLGALLNVEGRPFEVIGVVRWAPGISERSFLAGAPGALVPPGWLLDPKTGDQVSMIEVRVEKEIPEPEAILMIRSILTRGESSRDGLFGIQSLSEFLKAEQEFSKQTLGTLLAIAAISLFVGGIGVANVMLTSVTERTREIGVRKALGARRRDILLQFLVESCLLCAVGGALAAATAWLGIRVLPAVYDPGIALAFPGLPVAGCLVFTVLIGLVAGLYPASRAAERSSADALRYE